MNCLASLKANPTFESVPEEQLQWLVERSECRDYDTDTILFRPGDPIDHFMVVITGRVWLYTIQAGQQQEFALAEAGGLTGVLPFSRMKESMTYWQTLEPTTLLALHRDHFREMIQTQYELTETLVHKMTSRVRDSTRQMQQNDKMMSLGRMSAGLAHELNNPVSAVVRSAEVLKSRLHSNPVQFRSVMCLHLGDEQIDAVQELTFSHMKDQPQATPLSLMERSNLEDDLLDWLEDQQADGLAIQDASQLAEALVDFGFTTDDLESVLDSVGPANLGPILNWVVNNLMTEKLVDEINEATQRIANLVNAIKAYTHMDRGTGKETVRIREGIEGTLTLLKHKIKAKNIQVVVSVPDDLPPVSAYPSELNQVWTNLFDNAIDAMPDGGQLEVISEVDRNFVLTHVIDNGTGIAPDAIDHIFDPFFTTKEIGKGTGLGLEIVQGIMNHHNGRIYVESEPGRTEFKVCLPIE